LPKWSRYSAGARIIQMSPCKWWTPVTSMRNLKSGVWEPELLRTAERAAERVLVDLGKQSPKLTEKICAWLALRGSVSQPSDYFTHLQSLPILALPWWLERAIVNQVDTDFQTDLMCSSISGYYFSRMLDDLMDGHELDLSVVPALYPFYSRFQSTYFKYFNSSDPFWEVFGRLSMISAETATVDATLVDIAETEFVQFAAQKTAAGAIPLAAVCFRYGRPDILELWADLYALFGRWHQMRDDLNDWRSDYNAGNRTWFLCEAERQRTKPESIPAWICRKGFKWAADVMERWMDELIIKSLDLDSPELVAYLGERRASTNDQIGKLLRIASSVDNLLESDVFRQQA